jgi:DNA-binding NarL/FixJ family response regulator
MAFTPVIFAPDDRRAGTMWRPSILLVDDHTLVLEAFKKLLETEFDVVGTVTDGQSLFPVATELKPDVIVLDLGMPQLNTAEAGRELKKLLPRTKLVVLTMNEDPDVARDSLQHWASGFLLKKSAGSELVTAIRDALRSKAYVTPSIARRLQEDFIRDPRPGQHHKELTGRQREVLKLLAEGRTMKESAEALQITPRTVAFHKYKIMEEFGLKTNSDIVKLALREKVI